MNQPSLSLPISDNHSQFSASGIYCLKNSFLIWSNLENHPGFQTDRWSLAIEAFIVLWRLSGEFFEPHDWLTRIYMQCFFCRFILRLNSDIRLLRFSRKRFFFQIINYFFSSAGSFPGLTPQYFTPRIWGLLRLSGISIVM